MSSPSKYTHDPNPDDVSFSLEELTTASPVPGTPIRGKQPLGRQVVVSAIIVASLAITGFTLSHAGQSEPAFKAPADSANGVVVSDQSRALGGIETGPVADESVQSDLKTSGLLSYPADQTVTLSPRLQGRVTRLFVHVGDRVTAGQTVAQIVSSDGAAAETTALQNANKLRQANLDLQRQERLYKMGTPDVTAAQAAYDQASAAADAARDVLNTTTSQSKIGGFSEKPLEDANNALVSANVALEQARSDLQLAEKDYVRKQKLVQIGVAAQADLEVSQDSYEKAKASVAADEEASKLAKEAVDREKKAFGSDLYSKQQIEAAQNAYRQALVQKSAAATALQLAKTQIQRDLDQAQSDYQSAEFDDQNSQRTLAILGHPNADGTLNVTSPISGTITALNISSGQTVDQSQMTPWQIMTISNTSTLWVEADVYEKDIEAISTGSEVKIHVPAMPDREFVGKVLRISPVVDRTSRTVKVRAVIDNPQGLLKDGEYADVVVQAGHAHHALLVPLAAVEHEGDTDFVFIKAGDKFNKQKVELGAPFGERVEIRGGLKAGDVVVTKGAIYLGDQASDD